MSSRRDWRKPLLSETGGQTNGEQDGIKREEEALTRLPLPENIAENLLIFKV